VTALLTLLSFSPLRAQENSIRVVMEQNPADNTVIGAFRNRGTLYGSLTDLVQIFHVNAYTNPITGKMELKQSAYRFKITGGNPFIVITDQAAHQTVYQLSSNVMFAAGTIFVPIQSILPYFNLILDKSVRFDAAAGVLHIGNAPPASLFDIPAVSLEPKHNGMLIRIAAQKKIEDYESWLRPDGWFYVTLADAKADVKTINRVKGTGIVKSVVAIQSPGSVQLTFKLTGKIAATEMIRDDASNDLLLSIRTPEVVQDKPARDKLLHHKTEQDKPVKDTPIQDNSSEEKPVNIPVDPPAVTPEVTPTTNPPEEEEPEKTPEKKPGHDNSNDLSSQKRRWGLDVIVIDPGHGGYDPGTIGVTGVKEKDVTLGVARRLGQLIHADHSDLRDVRVVFTRTTDTFVPLYSRGQIANESGGKLFVSIHCNSTARKPNPQRGFEVYLLRPGRTEEAIAIAERENAVIQLEEGYEERYKQLTDENFILVTMAQSAYMRSSELLAGLVQKQMASVAGLLNHGVKQAGFYVLVGAAMPNVLVETAYLSNREDEKFLKNAAGQQKVAEALYRAIRKYKVEYEKLLANE
jgi:N-acetylmuramoyl-L-alanine amidase